MTGAGGLQRDSAALPRFSRALLRGPGDCNVDGHLDLFVRRRVVARHYGVTPRSYLLENDGPVHFRRHAPESPGARGSWDGDLGLA